MTLKTIEALRGGDTLESLYSSLGISTVYHPYDNRIILNYSHIESPRNHPIVNECRALVLDKSNYAIVAKGFNRFFNWGEQHANMCDFNWNQCVATEKIDGSLILVYYYNNSWHINTRNSFGDAIVNQSGYTWRQIFFQALDSKLLNNFNKNCTYIFELGSPYNKIVAVHNKPSVWLLGIINNEYKEYTHIELCAEADRLNLTIPTSYNFNNVSDVQGFIEEQGHKNKTFEGVVIRDNNDLRFKLKQSYYLVLHKMRGEGNNLFHPKYLLDFILTGECDELLSYFPEVKPTLDNVILQLDLLYHRIISVWEDCHNFQDQKSFALVVKDHNFAPILFKARKDNTHPQEVWNNSKDLLLKILFPIKDN